MARRRLDSMLEVRIAERDRLRLAVLAAKRGLTLSELVREAALAELGDPPEPRRR
jgi:hypothetical protein